MSKDTDPRDRSDESTTKQTEQPWKGDPEKEQGPPEEKPDLEKWSESDTH